MSLCVASDPTTDLAADGERLLADEVAFLVDADAYYTALAQALCRAKRCIYIAGWDIDARAKLPDPARKGRWVRLTRLLDRLARRRPNLRVYLLGWDFAALFALERQPFPKLHLDWATHERVRFIADGVHPSGASHHQKIVVVDDRVAFSGGLDIAVNRWDTPVHAPHDPARVGPSGEPYAPFHDLQIVVSGPAAKGLGDLFRERWRRACGELLEGCDVQGVNPWPPHVEPAAKKVHVELSCTMPAWTGHHGRDDLARSIARALRRAKRTIYIENQYLSCETIAELLAARLSERDGPEVVIVAPKCCSGWLEEATMGVLRAAFLTKLREAPFAPQRLRIVHPFVEDQAVFVHAKVMVIDDATARVGSANLSGRSMAIDTECDVTVLAEGVPAHRAAVASLRDRLLAEHLGRTVSEIREALARHGSTVRIVDELGSPRRGLRRLEDVTPSEDELVWLRTIADPERPLEASRLITVFSRYVERTPSARAYVLGAMAVTMLGVLLAIFWVSR